MTRTDSPGVSRRSILKGGAVAGAVAALTGVIRDNPADAATATSTAVHNGAAVRRTIPSPEEYFGFAIGAEGRLATWDKMVPYFKLIGTNSNRVQYEVAGQTVRGNPYVKLVISSPANLARLDDYLAMNDKLADPRGLSPTDAETLCNKSLPFYFVQAGIHSTEVGNSQATINWAYRLATEESDYMNNLLDNLIIVMVPCQNPDGLVLVNDYFVNTDGTNYSRTYPDLYNYYTGHDDNRDWFMLSQIESQINVSILNKYHPVLFQDSHQAGGSAPRMFTPPYLSPTDVNIDPILVQSTDTAGLAMQRAMSSAGQFGTGWGAEYDYWNASRQYCVYHGAARILTEAASCSNLAYTQTSSAPLGQQTIDINFIKAYSGTTWSLQQIVDYVTTAFYAGLEEVAYDRYNWLKNFYRIGVNAITVPSGFPYAYVIPSGQRDPQAVRDVLNIFLLGAVEVHQSTGSFSAGGKSYPAGSYIIYMAQPYGGFAKTLLEVQDYPQLLQYPGGPPQRPYDVTAQTLPMLLGFEADAITSSFSTPTTLVKAATPAPVTMPSSPGSGGAWTLGPDSYGVFQLVSRAQNQGIPVYRAAAQFTDGGKTYPAGTFILPVSSASTTMLTNQSKSTGIPVGSISALPAVTGIKFKPKTKIGLMKPPDNMPSGWLMWMFDQYLVNYDIVKSQDYPNLSGTYDTIIMPDGVSMRSITTGLSSTSYPPDWSWAFGVGTTGYNQLHDFVTNGGTLISFGSGTTTAIGLFDLPLKSVIPTGGNSTFYCPGSLLSQVIDPTHPTAWGMPSDNPVWYDSDDAYQITDTTKYPYQVFASYPTSGDQLQSGWLIGGEALNGAVNGVSWQVGDGWVVTFGNEPAFRTWNRSETKMIYNAMYYGPSTKQTTLAW